MSVQKKPSLSDLMKKQMSQKASKKNSGNKSSKPNAKSNKNKDENKNEEDQDQNQEEMTEEEKLEEAKKVSKGKAAQYNQNEMIKKLILENIVKYTILMSVIVIFLIGIIKFGSLILSYLNGLIFKLLMSALQG